MANPNLEYFVRLKNEETGKWEIVGEAHDKSIGGWDELFRLKAENPNGKYDLQVRVKEQDADR